MTSYDPKITAVLCVDLYNDFLSDGGKLFPWIKDIAEENNMVDNLHYVNWKYPSPYQLGAAERQAFAKGTWGGTFHNEFQVQPGDIVATEHWASSGFPNTDLDQLLKRNYKEKIILIGLLANTCLEATGRIGMELGYHVTLVRDATSARSHEALRAAMDINGPTYAHEVLTTRELIAAITSNAT